MKVIFLLAVPMLVTGLNGCVSQPTKVSIDVINEIRSGNYGQNLNEISFPSIKNDVVQGILSQIRRSMVDPDSTKITAIQTENFEKCVLYKIGRGIPNPDSSTPKGYCVAFEYNSRNRMGGYGGSQPSVALLQIDSEGGISMYAPTKALKTSEKIRYPYTPKTGVYALSYGF